MIVYAATTLDVPADTAWELLRRRSNFLFITRGAMCFQGTESWPEILMAEGVEIETVARPLCFLPGTHHTIRIVRVDGEAMEIDTEESGGFIRVWNHSMQVEAISDSRCRYSDRIDVRAGILTPLIWLLASLFYRYRQYRWRRFIARLVTTENLSPAIQCARKSAD